MFCLENLVYCLFIKKCLIEVFVKMGFICGVFFKVRDFLLLFFICYCFIYCFFILNVFEKYFYYENSEDGF